MRRSQKDTTWFYGQTSDGSNPQCCAVCLSAAPTVYMPVGVGYTASMLVRYEYEIMAVSACRDQGRVLCSKVLMYGSSSGALGWYKRELCHRATTRHEFETCSRFDPAPVGTVV